MDGGTASYAVKQQCHLSLEVCHVLLRTNGRPFVYACMRVFVCVCVCGCVCVVCEVSRRVSVSQTVL